MRCERGHQPAGDAVGRRWGRTRRGGDLGHRGPLHEAVGQHRSEACLGERLLGELGVAFAGDPDRGQALGRDLGRSPCLARDGDDLGRDQSASRRSQRVEGVGREAVENRLALPTRAGTQRRVGGVEQALSGAVVDRA